MKLKKFLLRYYPPGIIIEYVRSNGGIETKSIDLLNLSAETNLDELVNEIVQAEPIIPTTKKAQLKSLIAKLIDKLESNQHQNFVLFKTLKAHILPLTHCAFNKNGDKFLTGSYDRTCKIWDTQLGEELFTLEGHKNVVYTVAFNVPFGDKVLTGSFDKTAKIWDTNTGQLLHTLTGHKMEIVCVSFDPHGTFVATGSMDQTVKVWDVETGEEIYTLKDHQGEVVSLNFNAEGDKLLTGSFDTTAKIWDIRTGECIHTLAEHKGEISSTQFEFTGEYCATGSIDRTCKLWDIGTGKCVETFRGHLDEVLDISFNSTGTKLVTASADTTARVHNVHTGACTALLTGHEGEISKVSFNPQGSKIITASSDKTARIWSAELGDELRPEIARAQKAYYDKQDEVLREKRWVSEVERIIAEYQYKIKNVQKHTRLEQAHMRKDKKNIMSMIKAEKSAKLEAELHAALESLKKLETTSSALNSKMTELSQTKAGLRSTITKIQRVIGSSPSSIASSSSLIDLGEHIDTDQHLSAQEEANNGAKQLFSSLLELLGKTKQRHSAMRSTSSLAQRLAQKLRHGKASHRGEEEEETRHTDLNHITARASAIAQKYAEEENQRLHTNLPLRALAAREYKRADEDRDDFLD